MYMRHVVSGSQLKGSGESHLSTRLLVQMRARPTYTMGLGRTLLPGVLWSIYSAE